MKKDKENIIRILDLSNITYEEFNKAWEIVERYKYQQKPKTYQVSVTYNASVNAVMQVPAEWSIDEIKKELKHGYYDFDLDDEPETELGEITELIVNGEYVDLKKGISTKEIDNYPGH